jgi:hypothetical protein
MELSELVRYPNWTEIVHNLPHTETDRLIEAYEIYSMRPRPEIDIEALGLDAEMLERIKNQPVVKREPRVSLTQFREKEYARLKEGSEPPVINVRELITYPQWEAVLEGVSKNDFDLLDDAYGLYQDVIGMNLWRQHSDGTVAAACQELDLTFSPWGAKTARSPFRYEQCARLMTSRTGLPPMVCEALIDWGTAEYFVDGFCTAPRSAD